MALTIEQETRLSKLVKEMKSIQSKTKKIEYKSVEWFSDSTKKLFADELEVKKVIIEEFGRDALVVAIIGKRRKDGLFKQSNSKGYGNM